MRHLGTQTLLTPRLVLRRNTVDDAPQMFSHWANDHEVTRYLTWQPHASVDQTRQILEGWVASYEQPDFYQWGIELRETGELIGNISMVDCDESIDSVEIGYCLGRPWWRQGLMPEALARVMAFFFGEVGANRVCAKHDVDNPASGAVMAKCGMRLEGVRRAGIHNNAGQLVDVACYAMLAEDRNS